MYTLSDITKHLNATLEGEGQHHITGVGDLADASDSEITLFKDAKRLTQLKASKAGAVIISSDVKEHCPTNAIIVDNPELAYASVASLFARKPESTPGIHPTAVIGEGCTIAESVSIGAHCVIGNRVQIKTGSVVCPGSVIGDDCRIGANTFINPHVTFYASVTLGDRCVIHSGVVIGADGFGFSNDQGKWVKIPQLGTVEVGDDVEIGANSSIDCAAIRATKIGNGVKIDNQVQIGHNVEIGDHTIIAGCTGIAGSTVIGKHCVIGGAANINGHIHIADRVIIAGAACVHGDIKEPGVYSSGVPLQKHNETKRMAIGLLQLRKLIQRVRALEKATNA